MVFIWIKIYLIFVHATNLPLTITRYIFELYNALNSSHLKHYALSNEFFSATHHFWLQIHNFRWKATTFHSIPNSWTLTFETDKQMSANLDTWDSWCMITNKKSILYFFQCCVEFSLSVAFYVEHSVFVMLYIPIIFLNRNVMITMFSCYRV